jgi:serine/threonine-protein kinase
LFSVLSEVSPPFRRFGPYLILQLSGAGGMGRVDIVLWSRPGGFTKVGVLKRMRPELRTPEQEARFRREASIALRMSHGAIAQTLDVVEIDGEICLLQELVHGTTLAQLEHRAAGADERLPVPLVVHVTAEIARALAYAHSFDSGGVIHRDVTPDNIMLSFSGEPKLVDFGIARSAADQPLTEIGMVVGRPLYTAPEILAGHAADARSDVFSLGVVFWQALAGREFPGVGGSPAERAPPPSSANTAVPPELDAIALKATASRPEDRYATADEMHAALAASLPQGYVASRELAAFLARHFNVERERRELAESIERARGILAAEQPPVSATPPGLDASPDHRARAPRRGAALIFAGGLALGAVVAGAAFSPRRSPVVPRTEPSADVPPAQPAPSAVVAASQPRLPPAEVAEPPAADQTAKTRRVGRSTEHAIPARDNAALLRDADRSFRSGDLSTALDLARRAVRENGGGEAHLIMGKIFYSRNQLPEAEAEFERAQQARQPDASRYLDLVRQDLARAGR